MPTPKFPRYKKNDLRPNPFGADPSRGEFAFAQGSSTMGDFGDESADARRVNGLPIKRGAEGKDDPTIHGFIPSPGGTPLLLGAQTRSTRGEKKK